MPNWTKLTMPREEVAQLRQLVLAGMPQFEEPNHPRNLRILARLDAALGGKDLRTQNTWTRSA